MLLLGNVSQRIAEEQTKPLSYRRDSVCSIEHSLRRLFKRELFKPDGVG